MYTAVGLNAYVVAELLANMLTFCGHTGVMRGEEDGSVRCYHTHGVNKGEGGCA